MYTFSKSIYHCYLGHKSSLIKEEKQKVKSRKGKLERTAYTVFSVVDLQISLEDKEDINSTKTLRISVLLR